MGHKLVAMLGGADAARIAVALVASLGVHAGAALWVDGWSPASPEPSARSIQVRLTHAPARELIATRTPEHLLPAAVPPLTAAAMPGTALRAVAAASVATEPPALGAAAVSVTATPVTAHAVRRAAAPRPTPARPPPVAASPLAQPPLRTARAPAAPTAVAPESKSESKSESRSEAQRVPRIEHPSAVSSERAVDTAPQLAADNAPPQYPAGARRRGEEGQVLLRVQVLPDGTASAPSVVRSSGVASLDRAARVAVARWRFKPASSGGRAVEATVEVPVVFRLDGPG